MKNHKEGTKKFLGGDDHDDVGYCGITICYFH